MENETDSNDREKQARARALWMKGYKAHLKGDVKNAIQAYRASLKIAPSAEAHTYLGWAYSFQGHLREAIDECLKAIEVDPAFGNPYNDIGAYLIEQDQWEEAIPWLEKANQAERYEPRHYPHFNLGRVYLHLGRTEEAVGEFQKALELSPDYTPARQVLAQIQSRYN